MSEWISVKDKMPPRGDQMEEGHEVLLYHPFERSDGSLGHAMFVGYWDGLNRVFRVDWCDMIPFLDMYTEGYIYRHCELKKKQVTHWMPLPKPPLNKTRKSSHL